MDVIVIFGNETQGLGILRFLKDLKYKIFLFDKDSEGVAKYSKHKAQFHKTPEYSKHEDLLDFFINIAKEYSFTNAYVFSTDDEQVKFLSKYRNELKPYYNIKYPDWNKLSKLFFKSELCSLAKEYNIPIPETFLADRVKLSEINYPIIIKPSEKDKFLKRFKKKALECKNRNELETVLKQCEVSGISLDELMIQQIIYGGGDSQYSIVGVFEKNNYIYKRTAIRKRQHPPDYGKASTYVELTEDNLILEDYSKILLSYAEYSGPFEVEFKYDTLTKKYYLLDVNLRFWGWHSILKDEINIPKLLINEKVEENNIQCKVASASWINIVTDIPVALSLIIKGKLGLLNFFKQALKSHNAIFDIKDPVPFIMQVLLIPYLIIKRGY